MYFINTSINLTNKKNNLCVKLIKTILFNNIKRLMDGYEYVGPKEIKKRFNISTNSLRKWALDGKIRFIRPNGSRRLYHTGDVKKFFGAPEAKTIRQTAIYARVSSSHQKDDLERQIKLLRETYPDALLFKDVASGLNWRRPGFVALLEAMYDNRISTIVVSYKDRLLRFGYELFEFIAKKADTSIVVLNRNFENEDATRELSEDLLSIVNVFVAKNNGMRSGKYKKQRKDLQEQKDYSIF
jgi:predicted site-specific integrase-resolvase